MAYGFIYMTENLVNHKKYIGQRHYDESGEWEKYLGSGKYLMRAIQKYGRKNFKRIIIDEAETPSELNEKEIYWISYYNATQDRNYYNIAAGGHQDSLAGYSMEEREIIKSRQRMAVSERSKQMIGELAPAHKLTEHDVIEIIPRLERGDFRSDIARDYHVHPNTIQDIAKHRTWTYLTDGHNFLTPDLNLQCQRGVDGCTKAVDVYNLDGAYVGYYKSQREAARSLNISYKHIPDVCNGRRSYTDGYIFRYHVASSEAPSLLMA